jgi:hypothetical protein
MRAAPTNFLAPETEEQLEYLPARHDGTTPNGLSIRLDTLFEGEELDRSVRL